MKNLLISLLIILSVVFIALQLYGLEFYAATTRAVMLFGLTILYNHVVKTKRFWFSMFLITFLLAELLVIVDWINLKNNFIDYDYLYFTGNSLYIVSYLFLIIQVIRSMNIREVFLRYPLHIFILLILDVFVVMIVTNTTEGILDGSALVLEFTYNSIIMVLLSLALLNYIYRDDKKSMNLLMGSIFIVFSEVIQFAYFFIADFNVLNVACSIFLVLAFLFLYLQARMVHEDHSYTYLDEALNEEYQEIEI